MTQDLFDIIRFWFQWAWNFATGFFLPGTNVTPAGIAMFGIAAVIGLRFIKSLFAGVSGSGHNSGAKTND